MNAWQIFTESLSSLEQPDAAFTAFCNLANEEVGLILFTALAYDKRSATVCRTWSNSPEHFPVGTVSPVPDPPSYEAGMRIINGCDGIVKAFSHYEAIFAVGCASSLALPVVVGDQFLGTLCFLHREDHFTPDRVKIAQRLIVPGTVCFLIAKDFDQKPRAYPAKSDSSRTHGDEQLEPASSVRVWPSR